jgi:hypothetical protein
MLEADCFIVASTSTYVTSAPLPRLNVGIDNFRWITHFGDRHFTRDYRMSINVRNDVGKQK